MKEKILQALKTKYNNLGFSEKALDGVATYLTTSVTEETQIETAISGVENLLKMFQSEQDSLRGEKTEAGKQLAELKKQIEILGGKKEPEPPKIEDGEKIPAWAKLLIEKNNKFEESLNKLATEKVSNSRKATIDNLIKDLPEQLKKPYARMNFDNVSDEDFSKQVEEIKGEVESIGKELGKSGLVFGAPANNKNEQPTQGILSEKEIQAIAGDKF